MQKFKQVITQSGVIDRELIPPQLIVESAKLYNNWYVPITDEHDIRKPPIGRLVSAEVVVHDDGTHVLQGEGELFEEDDNLESLPKSDKSVRIYAEEVASFEVLGNQTFEKDEDVVDLYQELRKLGSGDTNSSYREYSIEPISLLIIGFGIFTLQGIANGFLSKLGEDLYEQMKLILKKIFDKKYLNQKENLLQFQIFVKSQVGRIIEVNIVITNPSQHDLEYFFDDVQTILDAKLSSLPIDDLDMCRVVFSYEFKQLKLLYALRSDCVPILPDRIE